MARIERGGHPFTRVTFRGGDLAHFSPIGPDQFLYLLLPPAGRRELTIDAGFNWDQFREMPEAERPIGAYYTVRHFGRRRRRWILRLCGTDTAVEWGRGWSEQSPAIGWGCGGRGWCTTRRRAAGVCCCAGNETALPAIGAILESGPQAESVTVVVELDPHTVPPFEAGAELEVIRLIERRRQGWQLPDAMRTQTLDADTYVWGAGEMN